MNKKRAWSFVITAVLLFSAVGCSKTVSEEDGMVTIKKEEYDSLIGVYSKYAKAEYLKEQIHEEFYNEVTEDELLEGVYHGIFESLEDQYSVYMDADEFKKYMEESSGTYYGIGVRVGKDEMNFIRIFDFTAENTPAQRAGMKINDQIIAVEGVEYTGEELTEAISVMKSTEKEGTVKIKVRRESGDKVELLEFDVEREEIRYIESIQGEMLDKETGYIRIVQFDDVVSADFISKYKELQEQGMKRFVLDLRSNPGGRVDTAVEIADFLLGETIVVYTEDKYGERVYHRSDAKKAEMDFVVLVNGLTASAAEILSGAIQDLEEAPIVGTQTFGKGIVQKIIPLDDGSGYKYTVSKYFTPKGENIHEKGITPDVVVELPQNVEGIGLSFLESDTQLQKALELLGK